ncbi:SDR family NAD(P)-dependent oxidoreductase [Nannocystis sp. SCPEA4]|uniref:SDR family NAD(P)-dependent oxidoreductase n=1 Tax=Nannocystis sp. SCPEA4 TaxID=2996787 RepID=UPI00226E12A5|nr:SDR family NAD(P)-dependent oxidoreductase [Nannocystis sp. SCPEA4]MCY1060105.1 SDR family NAD(P)-dependent oxidoreductase [Nannocystis sp. SCPEA4]
MSTFKGKVAAVTGAGSGIGRALALGLARRGARLALSDVDEAGLAETARVARTLAAEVDAARLDVSDGDAVKAYATAVAARFGNVHQIYNNAGIAFSRSVIDSTFEDYERVLAVNLRGVIHGTLAFLPHLIASGDGHVVNISSLNGFMAQGQMSHYCTAKFAVRGFTESLRIEMLAGALPVRVTVVHPGGVKTNIASAALARARASGLAVTAEDEARERMYNEKLLKLSPDLAAETILAGVARDQARVLVGNDARAVDLLVRAFPVAYQRAAIALGRRLTAAARGGR